LSLPAYASCPVETGGSSSEFETFLERERELGLNRLILPVYYVVSDAIEDSKATDPIAVVLRERNWTDWRPFRFKAPEDQDAAMALAGLARTIKVSMAELESIFAISDAKAKASKRRISRPAIQTEADAPPLARDVKFEMAYASFAPDVPEARPGDKLDRKLLSQMRKKPYFVYTKRFDEVLQPGDFLPAEELLRLYRSLARITTKLKRENKIRLNQLTRARAERKHSETSVMILVDNSGSMRGDKIRYTAAWCLFIAEWLESLSVKFEVIGYTTRAWKGGRSRELWLLDRKPTRPGRLNDLRHIVYKSFDAAFRETAANFGAMLREGLLKENIDGESLLWAYDRLKAQPAKHKLLFVLSDGASVDDATISVNDESFLELHLRCVARYIKDRGDVELVAIGIQRDVSQYYINAIEIAQLPRLGLPIVEKLSERLGAD
jgi:cobalamin biosynthesis protein CobT